jgi:GNAT superfamily N-acetyltransferase
LDIIGKYRKRYPNPSVHSNAHKVLSVSLIIIINLVCRHALYRNVGRQWEIMNKISDTVIVEIRKAIETEIEILLSFEKEIIKTERPFDSSLKQGEIHYYDLIELIRTKRAEVLVAVANNEIVGSGYAKILPAEPFQKYIEYAYLGFMYVKPEFRGRGVNQKILHGLIDWAKGQNLTEVRLEVYDENTIAKNAYLKAGFKPNLLEMRLEL